MDKYIFCKWQDRLWPAKVVTESGISPQIASKANQGSVNVQLICLEKRLRIKRTDTRPFEQKQAEQISRGLRPKNESTHNEAMEELTYRKALRIALNLLASHNSSEAHNTNGISVPRQNRRQLPQRQTRRSAEQCASQAPSDKKTPELRQRKKTNSQDLSKTVKKPEARLKMEEGRLQKSSNQVTQNNSLRFSQTDASSPRPSLRSKELAAEKTKHKDKERRMPQVGRKSSVKGSNSVGETAEKDQNHKCKHGRRTYEVANKHASANCSARADYKQEQLEVVNHLESTPKRRTASARRSFGLSQTLNESDSSRLQSKRCLGQSERRGRKKQKKDPEHIEYLTTSTTTANLDIPLESLQNGRTQQQLTDLEIKLSENGPMDSPDAHNQTSSSDSPLPYFPFDVNKQHVLPLSGTGQEERGLELLASPVTNPATPLKQPWEELEFTSEHSFSNEPKEENGAEEEDEEDELPSILQQEKCWVVAEGLLVWCKFHKYPYWPAVVRSVKHKYKKASILFVDENVVDAKEKSRKGICVSVRTLKPFDCKEREQLMDAARKTYKNAIDWCVGLIDDYRIRQGCYSFTGSFVDYCAAELSIPLRKTCSQDPMTFPCASIQEAELESQSDITPSRQQRVKKLLPDRRKAARDQANEKLVHFIVQTRGVEKHLQAVIKGQQHSHWLGEYISCRRNSSCIDTYLEDDRQVDKVVNYLQSVFDGVNLKAQLREDFEKSRFILDVLLPEAVIHAIAEVDRMSIKQAEDKYLKGPLHSGREVEHFNEEVEHHMKVKLNKKSAG